MYFNYQKIGARFLPGLLQLLLVALPIFLGAQSALDVSVGVPQDAHICGTSNSTVVFSNTSSDQCVLVGDTEIELDPSGLGLITLSNVPGQDPLSGWELISGQGTSNPVVRYNGILQPGTSTTLVLEIQYSCAYFDLLDQLTGKRIQLNGVSGEGPCSSVIKKDDAYEAESDFYEIQYTFVSPQLGLPRIQILQHQPFGIEIPLEITGNYQDGDFMVSLSDLPTCLDFSNATFAFNAGGQPYIFTPQLLSYPNGVIEFEVDVRTLGAPLLCEANYNGGLGNEASLSIQGIVTPCGCGTPGSFDLAHIGFTTCNYAEAPINCLDNGRLISQIETVVEIEMLNDNEGTLSLTPIGEYSFNVCTSSNILRYNLSNNTSQPVYDISLELSNALNFNVTQIQLNSQTFPILPPSPFLVFDLDNVLANIPELVDLDGDGNKDDMLPGTSIVVLVYYDKLPNSCPFDTGNDCGGKCNTVLPFIGSVLTTNVFWNNYCKTELQTETVLEPAVILPTEMNVKHESDLFESNDIITISLEIGSVELDGLDGLLAGSGSLQQYFCVWSNAPDCMTNQSLSYVDGNGNTVSAVYQNGRFEFLQNPFVPIDLQSFQYTFTLFCCQGAPDELTISFSTGVYFENCPECTIPLACGDASLLIGGCSAGNPNDPVGQGGACNFLTPIFTIKNPADPFVTEPVKVYPCDELDFEFEATVQNSFLGQLVVGFAVSNEFVDYFTENLIASPSFQFYNGSNWVPIDFGNNTLLESTPIPGAPYTLFQIASIQAFFYSPQNLILGEFHVRMNDAFNDPFEKVDHFIPVMGFKWGNTTSLCGDFYEMYALDPEYTIEYDRFASCTDGGTFSVNLIKQGGELLGPDFPNAPFPGRVVAQFNSFMIDVDGMPIMNPTISLANGYAPRGDVIQSLSFDFDENCDATIPISISGKIEKLPGSTAPCNALEPFSASSNSSGVDFPEIVAQFTDHVQVVTTNTTSFEINTTNLGLESAENVWIQLEYNPDLLEISYSGVEQSHVVEQTNCGLKLLVVNLSGGLDYEEEISQIFDVTFFKPSCDVQPGIRVTGIHSCTETEYTGDCPAMEADGYCPGPTDFVNFILLDADLILETYRCEPEGEFCETRTLSVLITNPEQGDVSDLQIQVETPIGISLIDASWENGGELWDCTESAGATSILPNDLLSGWNYSNENLPGIQGGASDEDRRLHLLLEFKVGCGYDPMMDDVVISVNGIKPCGELIEKEVTIIDYTSDLDVDFEIVASSSSTYVVHNGTGTISLNVTEINGLNNLPPNASVTLEYETSQGVILTNIPTVDLNNLFGTHTASFILDGSENVDCNFFITQRIILNIPRSCDGEECATQEVEFEFTETPAHVTATMEVVGDPCQAEPMTLITVNLSFPEGLDASNLLYNFFIYCDLNLNGIADPQEPRHFIAGSWGGSNNMNPYPILVPVDFLTDCPSQQVLIVPYGISVFDGATAILCIDPIVGTYCCDCPGGMERSMDKAGFSESEWDTKVYPNPFDNQLSLIAEHLSGPNMEIRIFDLLGREVYRTEIETNNLDNFQQNIDLSELSTGIYMMETKHSDQQKFHTIIKQ